MQIIQGDQNTPEWDRLRLASIGGTAINLIAPMGKGYKDQLYVFAGEYITGVKHESYKFKHADRGHEYEPPTWDNYVFQTGASVEHVSIIKSDKPHRHCSPDALIDANGIGEGKVRIPSVFAKAATEGHFPIATKRQIQWSLDVCEREWADYVQFCPEMQDAGVNGLLIQRVYRDEKMIAELNDAADQFIDEMLVLVERIKAA